jgi:hypothetical protein
MFLVAAARNLPREIAELMLTAAELRKRLEPTAQSLDGLRRYL